MFTDQFGDDEKKKIKHTLIIAKSLPKIDIK